ncbi:unnamed protein product [Heterobilharzia americana]|nr:unnamed protein product [Heterobilharzia americana]
MNSSVIVAVRLRPFTKDGASEGPVCPVSMPKPGTVHLSEPNAKSNNIREYKFDHTFWSLDREARSVPYASQEVVYNTLGFPLLLKALEGYNTCIFAYGMTSSGKTYSITGPPDDPGIIPRIAEGLFEEIEKRTSSSNNFCVKMSYYEIYNERIRDLLCSNPTGNGLVIREHPVTGPYIDGLLSENVYSALDISKWLGFGNRLRTVAATPLNDNSSRSHTVLTLSLTKRSTMKYSLGDVDNVYNSQITIVDLAGSERQTSTSTLGGRFIESCQINKSLFTLGKVITQLSQNATNKKKPFLSSEPRLGSRDIHPVGSVTPCRFINKRRNFVSYRDSLLTWLLKDSLGGNAITVMLVTISPCPTHYDETLSTLRYAKKASSIVNSAVVNEDPKSQLIHELISEIRNLRQKASSILFEPGTCQAYEVAKLQELISIREQDVHQLRRRLTDHRFEDGNTSDRMIPPTQYKSTQTSTELYLDDTDPGSQISPRSLFDNNCVNTVTPLRIGENKRASLILVYIPITPTTHCQLVEQIASLKSSLQSVQDELARESLSAKYKVEELDQKVIILQRKLQTQTRLLDNFRQAFDRLNRNYQSVLQLCPQLLKKIAYATASDHGLSDITNQLVPSCVYENSWRNENESESSA